jgi:arylsulfatase A-like enzyme
MKSILRLRALFVGGLAGALAACGGAHRPTSILLVTLDTTRADRIGCYGRANAGTQSLDALAARGARFERAYTTAPITLPAHASLLTGSYPPYHGLRDNGLAALDESVETLAETCRRAGLRTAAAVSGFPVARPFGLAQGFERYDDEFDPAPEGAGAIRERRGAATARVAADWLATLGSGEGFFLWVHLFDAHEPYRAPAEFAARFPDDAYQAEVACADAALGQLLAALTQLGREGDTLVCVAADHGEGLGEHGEETHALLLYDSTLHVPLVLAGPGIAPRVVAEPVSLADVAATLVDEAGVPDGGIFTSRSGRSLAPLLRGSTLPPRELYFETYFPRLHFGWSELVGLARAEWKYVEAPGAEPAVRAELYEPRSDPREERERAAAEPELCRELGTSLQSVRHALAANAAPSTRRTQSAGELDALAALGYGGADALARVPGADEAAQPGRDPRRVVGAVTLLNQVRALAGAGRFDESAAALARLAALDPGAVMVDEARGDQALARGRRGERAAFEEAAAAFAAACELEPGRRGLWLRRFEALKALDRLAEALACLDHALELAPATPEFRRARDELAREVERRKAKGGG